MSTYIHLEPEDIVCVALSGGKDSISLLYNLYLRFCKTQSPKLIALTVDEGISNTFDHNQSAIKEFFKNYQIDVPLIKASFKDIFGLSMDQIVQKIQADDLKLNACTVCASIRRRIINELAKEMGATKIAIGHNLDDVAQSLIMNVLRKDLHKIKENSPFETAKKFSSRFLPRIKPLFMFTEDEIIQYCNVKELPYFSHTCQYSVDFPILRKKVQKFIKDLDDRSFEYKYNIIRFHLQINSEAGGTLIPKYTLCKICSYPTGSARDLCTFCEYKRYFTSE